MIISEDLIDRKKYNIQFNLDKCDFRSIIEEIVVKEKLKFSCICGGYFTKLNGNKTTPDIYIFAGSNYNPKEEYLNTFLNDQFKKFKFDQLVSFSYFLSSLIFSTIIKKLLYFFN